MGKTSVEIIGLPGSGKSTLLNYLKNSNISKDYLVKNNHLIIEKVELIFDINYDFFLILFIVDFFIDKMHLQNITTFFKRIIKLNLVLFNSKKTSLKNNNNTIHESLIHLAIKSNRKNICKLYKQLLKIYRTEKLKLIYLKISPEEAILRMTNRGDKTQSLNSQLYQSYVKSTNLYNELIKNICKVNKNNVFILNSGEKLESNEELINWLKSA